MTTKTYLQQALTKSGAESRADFARIIGVDKGSITRYFDSDRTMDDYTATRVAEILGMNPMIVIAQANAEREKDEQKVAFWRKYAAGVTVAILVSFGMTTSSESVAASTTYTGRIDGTTHYGCFTMGSLLNRKQMGATLNATLSVLSRVQAIGQSVWTHSEHHGEHLAHLLRITQAATI